MLRGPVDVRACGLEAPDYLWPSKFGRRRGVRHLLGQRRSAVRASGPLVFTDFFFFAQLDGETWLMRPLIELPLCPSGLVETAKGSRQPPMG